MTRAPKTILEFQTYWLDHGGKAGGIVGDQRHCSGYHLGADRIYGPCACKPTGTCRKGLGKADYSVQYERDRKGLTDAAAAIDLGRLDGTYKELRRFSKWLVKRCQDSKAVRQLIREIIYSPDGVKVQRYSGYDNLIHTGPGNGDQSHTTHTHISFPRDTEREPKVWLIEPYFAEPPDTGTGGDMLPDDFTIFAEPREAVVPKGTHLYDSLELNEATAIIVAPGRVMPVVGKFSTGPLLVGVTPDDGTDAARVPWRIVRSRDVDVRPVQIEADCTEAVADARAEGYVEGKEAGEEAGIAAEKERIALAEADRIRQL